MSSPKNQALNALIYQAASLTRAPAHTHDVLRSVANSAVPNRVGPRVWVTLAAATLTTLNCPDGLLVLRRLVSPQTRASTGSHSLASRPSSAINRGPQTGGSPATGQGAISRPKPQPEGFLLPNDQRLDPVDTAELIREVGLKCITFNGIPRTINCLTAFRAGLPQHIANRLSPKASRNPTRDGKSTLDAYARGRNLWVSVHGSKIEQDVTLQLMEAHPDLPVHILNSHYGPLLTDPPGEGEGLARLGRILTNLVAIACLRAQTGSGDQLAQQVVGLRRAVGYMMARRQEGRGPEGDLRNEEGMEFLGSEMGCAWILRRVDDIVSVFGGGTFAPGTAHQGDMDRKFGPEEVRDGPDGYEW